MRIFAIAGSNRADAGSTKLAAYVVRSLREMGAQAELFELYRRPIPYYEPDYEFGGSAADVNLRGLLAEAEAADALVLSTPEYHGGVTGVMKNALDFLEKRHFAGKAVLSMATAGGPVAVSTLQQLQATTRYLHGVNCPEWISLGQDRRPFTDGGEPAHPDALKRVRHVTRYFYDFAKKQVGESES
ncbi:NAD(P)H-dependent oxidoreductase [Paenibacillus sp. TRM 82003]|nr:NAD(P)H-dependent oxidoreductase [Paenibacillus sp. TRM 82003]